MSYVDGFLLPLAEDKMEEYRVMAEKAGEIWMEHGALSYKECLIDDDRQKELVSFNFAAGVKPGEVAVLAYILFESREHRDVVNAKVMSDPRLKDICGSGNMPFDIKRMAYGGFNTLVDL